MKTEFRAVPHSTFPGTTVFEVWHDGAFIATVTGAEGPGVRIITKHPLRVAIVEGMPNVAEVRIEAK